jgi:hypothetical protein
MNSTAPQKIVSPELIPVSLDLSKQGNFARPPSLSGWFHFCPLHGVRPAGKIGIT